MVDFSIEETKLREFVLNEVLLKLMILQIYNLNLLTNIRLKRIFTFDLLDEETQKRTNINKIAIRIANLIDNATDKILRDKKR